MCGKRREPKISRQLRHYSLLRKLGDALTLTLSQREREYVTHPLRRFRESKRHLSFLYQRIGTGIWRNPAFPRFLVADVLALLRIRYSGDTLVNRRYIPTLPACPAFVFG